MVHSILGAYDFGVHDPPTPDQYRLSLVHAAYKLRKIIFPQVEQHIRGGYGFAEFGVHNGPFSYETYLMDFLRVSFSLNSIWYRLYLTLCRFWLILYSILQSDAWGDDCIAVAHSYAYGCTITILDVPTLVEHRIRHDRPLADVDIVLLYNGWNHYCYACEYYSVGLGLSFRLTFPSFIFFLVFYYSEDGARVPPGSSASSGLL